MEKKITHNLLLADDDIDDCAIFREALDDLSAAAKLTTVHDGVQLMDKLNGEPESLPDLIFLDLNMPRKSGFECLEDIKGNAQFKHLPVFIYSTSFNMDVVDLLYSRGANYYIRKPGNYLELKKVILNALMIASENSARPARDQFILYP